MICQSGLAVVLLLNASFVSARNLLPSGSPQGANRGAQADKDVATLALHRPIRRSLKGGERQSFLINLKAGQFIRLIVSRQDIEVTASLLAPDGRLIREESSLNSIDGEAAVFWVADADGAYRLDVRAPETDARPGFFVADISELRPGVARDKDLIAAEDALKEGNQLLAGGGQESPAAAYARFDKALSLLNAAGDRKRAPFAIRRKAFTFVIQGRAQDALPLYKEALSLLESEYGLEHIKVVPALWDLADAVARLGQFADARAMIERALKILEKGGGGDSLPAAAGLSFKARVLMAQNDDIEALNASQRARQIYERLYGTDSLHYASATALVAAVLQHQGQFPQAQSLFEQALKTFEKHYDAEAPELIQLLDPLSQVLLSRGEAEEGLAKHLRIIRIIEKHYGRQSPQAAQAYWAKGNILLFLRKPAEARAAYQLSLDVSPPVSPAAVSAVIGIANTFNAEDNTATARTKYDEAIKISEQLGGPDSPGVAYCLIAKIEAYRGPKDYAEGSRIFENLVRIDEKNEGADGFSVANALVAAGDYDGDYRKYPEARAKYQRAMKIYERNDGVDSIRVASLLEKMGEMLHDEGKYEEALVPLRSAVRTYEKLYGTSHPVLLGLYRLLALVYVQNKLFDDARSLLQRSLQILKDNHLDEELIATETLSVIAQFNFSESKYTAAQEAAESAVKIYEKYPQHRSPAEEIEVRNQLGLTLLMKGDLPRARIEMEKTLTLAKQRLGPTAPGLLMALSNMASLLATVGDLESIARHVALVQNLSQALIESEDPQAVRVLLLTSILAAQIGEKSEARELLKKAIDLGESFSGPNNFGLADLYATQAMVLGSMGDYSGSEEASTKADRMYEKLDPELSARAMLLFTKGEISIEQGKLPQARAAFEDGLRIIEKRLGAKHILLAAALDNLAWVHYLQGDVDQSRTLYLRATDVMSKYVRDVLPTLSLAEQRLFLDMQIPDQISGLLATCRNEAALRSAYESMFRWKGSLVDSLRRQTIITRLGRTGPLASQVKQLQDVRAKIAGLYYQAKTLAAEKWRQKNYELTEEKEALERELARALKPGELDDPLDIGLAGFQHVLGQDEVFVDVYLYNYWAKDNSVEERYAAVLTGPTGSPSLIDLGSARKINNAVTAWRNDVLSVIDANDKWSALTGLLWKPLADALPPRAQKIWISPDGELARVPWQLFPTASSHGRDILLTQTDSARELARLRQTKREPSTPGTTIFLAGNINFDAGSSPTPQRVTGKGFGRIEGAIAELSSLRDVGQKFRAQVIPLTGADADKTNVIANLQRATYSHLITHGFFSRESVGAVPTRHDLRFQSGLLDDLPPPDTRNPLIESGIALAGANVLDPVASEAKGLLTAEEIIGLDLRRSELVTLSACETGRGEEVTGQGVMGLRASVMAAGSRSFLMSLWKVPDEATAKFMEAFYTNLWLKKMTKAEALLRAQEAVRDQPSGKYRLPFYWGAWVLVGESW